jgi:uncharacterized protein YneR
MVDFTIQNSLEIIAICMTFYYNNFGYSQANNLRFFLLVGGRISEKVYIKVGFGPKKCPPKPNIINRFKITKNNETDFA